MNNEFTIAHKCLHCDSHVLHLVTKVPSTEISKWYREKPYATICSQCGYCHAMNQSEINRLDETKKEVTFDIKRQILEKLTEYQNSEEYKNEEQKFIERYEQIESDLIYEEVKEMHKLLRHRIKKMSLIGLFIIGIGVALLFFRYYEVTKARCDQEASFYSVTRHEIMYRSCMRQMGF